MHPFPRAPASNLGVIALMRFTRRSLHNWEPISPARRHRAPVRYAARGTLTHEYFSAALQFSPSWPAKRPSGRRWHGRRVPLVFRRICDCHSSLFSTAFCQVRTFGLSLTVV